MNKNLEIRSYRAAFRSEDDKSRVIRGLAIPVEARSELLCDEFYEIIAREAVNDDLINNNDIKLYINHDDKQGVFARSKYGKGSLKLYIDENGLNFETELPDNALGNYLLDAIRRQDIDAVSFAFNVKEEEWHKLPDGKYEHIIKAFDVLDEISCLYVEAAFHQTNVSKRSLESFKEEEVRAKEEAEKQAQVESLKKIADIEDDFNDLYKNFLNTAY